MDIGVEELMLFYPNIHDHFKASGKHATPTSYYPRYLTISRRATCVLPAARNWQE